VSRRALPVVAALAWVLLASAPVRGDGPTVDLVGTWHVLVHYTDDHTANPEQMRWDDRIWVFERKGERLRWTEYPIVVFADASGRFERRGGQYARVLHGWEPSPGQLEEIREGVEVNPRGKRSKTLRGSADEGWSSRSRPTSASASVITYVQNWSVENPDALPLFVQEDVLGSARTESLEGRTEYRTTELRSGGDLLVGRFERDGVRHGTFRMLRSGEVSDVPERRERDVPEAYRQGIPRPGGPPGGAPAEAPEADPGG